MRTKVKGLLLLGSVWSACLLAILLNLYQTKTSLDIIHQLRDVTVNFRQSYFEHQPYQAHSLSDVAQQIEAINTISRALTKQNAQFSIHPDLSQLLYTLNRFLDQAQQFLGGELDLAALVQSLQNYRNQYAQQPELQQRYFQISTYVFDVLYGTNKADPRTFRALDDLFYFSRSLRGQQQIDLQTALAKTTKVLNQYAQGAYLVKQLSQHPFYQQIGLAETEYEQLLEQHVLIGLLLCALFIVFVAAAGFAAAKQRSRGALTTLSAQSVVPPLTASPSAPSIIDFAALSDTLGQDLTAVDMLLNVFLADHGHDSELLRQAIERQDRPTSVRLAHSLKGIGGGLSAPQLMEAAYDLEMALLNKAPEVHALLERLTAILGRACEEARDYLECEK